MAGIGEARTVRAAGGGGGLSFCQRLWEARRFCIEDLVQGRGIPEREARGLAESILFKRVQRPVDIVALLEVMRVLESTELDVAKVEAYRGVCQMFSSMETLYWSFYKVVEEDEVQGIDFEDVCEFYSLLATIKDEELQEHLLDRIKDTVSSMHTGDRGGLVLLIIMMNPLLAGLEQRMLLKAVLRKLCHIRGGKQTELITQMSLLKRQEAQILTTTLHQHLTLTMYMERPETSLRHGLDVLALLFQANKKSKVLRHDEFYISAINGGDFDIEADFRRWHTSSTTLSLCNYPFVYDSGSKALIMNMEYTQTQGQAVQEWYLETLENLSIAVDPLSPYLVLRVHRGNALLQNTIDQIHAAKRAGALKRPLKVQFIGEAGVDEGGVAKEFFHLLLRNLFDTNYGMFTYDEDTRLWWFRSSALDLSEEFYLFGVILGIAIFNNHVLNLQFPSVVYKKLLRCEVDFSDLRSVFPCIHASLVQLLSMPSPEDLELCFEAESDTGLGGRTSTELLVNGRETRVTSQNCEQYVSLYTKFLLETSIQKQFTAFRIGFLSVCESQSLKMFVPEELEDAICGKQILDIDALKAATVYQSGYTSSHKVIDWFWSILQSFSEEKKRNLLSFVTSCDRVPIRGFAALTPKFTISRAGSHSDRLPTAHTCFNHLMFPEYKDKDTLERCLNIALDNAEGFGLM